MSGEEIIRSQPNDVRPSPPAAAATQQLVATAVGRRLFVVVCGRLFGLSSQELTYRYVKKAEEPKSTVDTYRSF